MKSVDDSLFYAVSLVGTPYRWYREGEEIKGDDKFWAFNGPPPSAVEIKQKGSCIVCTGLINLMRRFMGLSVPGLDGNLGADGLKWPGTTSTWYAYLKHKNRL